jgi:hypothetical protein
MIFVQNERLSMWAKDFRFAKGAGRSGSNERFFAAPLNERLLPSRVTIERFCYSGEVSDAPVVRQRRVLRGQGGFNAGHVGTRSVSWVRCVAGGNAVWFLTGKRSALTRADASIAAKLPAIMAADKYRNEVAGRHCGATDRPGGPPVAPPASLGWTQRPPYAPRGSYAQSYPSQSWTI